MKAAFLQFKIVLNIREVQKSKTVCTAASRRSALSLERLACLVILCLIKRTALVLNIVYKPFSVLLCDLVLQPARCGG